MMDAFAPITGYWGELGENAEEVLINSYYGLADLLDVYFEVTSSLMVTV
jgi:hypothetical protein